MNVMQPLYEFGALLRFLEENGLVKESLELHTKYKDLSKIYYKIKGNLSEEDLEDFETHETVAYCRFMMDMNKSGYIAFNDSPELFE